MRTFIFRMDANSFRSFDDDYQIWNDEIEATELAMQRFVKQLIMPVETVEGKLLVLKRFERLQLDCLCLDRRYLDVFVRFQLELENLKDT